MKEPRQKPTKSKQDYGTPDDFLAAVRSRFGDLYIDLAASPENAVCENYITKEDNSLEMPWAELLEADPLAPIGSPEFRSGKIGFLNPEFGQITAFAKHAAEQSQLGARVLMLVPAGIETRWFWNWVWPFADVHVLRPRLVFKGTPLTKAGVQASYPKPLILCDYNAAAGSGELLVDWVWKQRKPRAKRGKLAE